MRTRRVLKNGADTNHDFSWVRKNATAPFQGPDLDFSGNPEYTTLKENVKSPMAGEFRSATVASRCDCASAGFFVAPWARASFPDHRLGAPYGNHASLRSAPTLGRVPERVATVDRVATRSCRCIARERRVSALFHTRSRTATSTQWRRRRRQVRFSIIFPGDPRSLDFEPLGGERHGGA